MEINLVCWNIENLSPKKLKKLRNDIAMYIFREVQKGNVVFILESRTEEVFKILFKEVNEKLQKSYQLSKHASSQNVLGGYNFKCSGNNPREEYVLAFWDTTYVNVEQIKLNFRLFDDGGTDVRLPLVVDISKFGGREIMRIAAWHAPGPQSQVLVSAKSQIIQYARRTGVDAVVGDFNSHTPSGLPTAARSSFKPTHSYGLRQPQSVHVKPAITTIFGSSYDGVLDLKPALISVSQPTADLSMADKGFTSDHAPMAVRICKRSPPSKRGRVDDVEEEPTYKRPR